MALKYEPCLEILVVRVLVFDCQDKSASKDISFLLKLFFQYYPEGLLVEEFYYFFRLC